MSTRLVQIETVAAAVILTAGAIAASVAVPQLAMLLWLAVALIVLAGVMRLLRYQQSHGQPRRGAPVGDTPQGL
jgi:hypothetical protein